MILTSLRAKYRRPLYGLVIALIMIMCLPLPKDNQPFSNALYSADGRLLSASISAEQQWRLPFDEDIPPPLATCIITYEDAYFYYHLGINPLSILKSAWINVRNGKIKRGASTIPMQVMRLRNRSNQRSIWYKIYESLASIKYSIITSKSQVINDWASLAPFGGNTIGVKAAALRYFGMDVDKLSWSQYALLAVMPNGPSSANLDRSRQRLITKRNKLLDKLGKTGYIPLNEVALYKDEDLPTYLNKVPQDAYHLLSFASQSHPDQHLFKSTLDYEIQTRVQALIESESQFYKLDDIRNMAAVVIDIEQNKLISYVGNTKDKAGRFSYVDIVQSPRSYGSLLKPLLYALSIDRAQCIPGEMIEDIPTVIGDFQPVNFDKKYRGAVPIEDMILQSLNIPAVRMLQRVGLKQFYDVVDNLDLAYLDKGADHYGLSIILGGGESSLWDMARLYKGLAQNALGLNHPYQPVTYLRDHSSVKQKNNFSFDPLAIQYTIEAMSNINRPREERSWDMYNYANKIAWKTGTSFGHRDAWSIGFNGKYAVAVWVGNEGGEGRHDLTGIVKAAPVMFKIFNMLPTHKWFPPVPSHHKKQIVSVCLESGRLAGHLCKQVSKIKLSATSMQYRQCDFHQVAGITADGRLGLPPCDVPFVKLDTFFVLPPYISYYYKESHLDYAEPNIAEDLCHSTRQSLAILYPLENIKIFVPYVETKDNPLIAKAYHPSSTAKLYWFLDDTFVQTTTTEGEHHISLQVKVGQHRLHISDQYGGRADVRFEVLGK
jgi:penicillin-binding protein 1C